MKNEFFSNALKKAAAMTGKPGRLILLASSLVSKLRTVDWGNVNRDTARDKFYVLGRLIKAYATGQYREIPWKTLLVIVAAVIYFINPVDLIPDLVPALGFTDDFAVLLWVYNSVNMEIGKFLSWEQSKVAAS